MTTATTDPAQHLDAPSVETACVAAAAALDEDWTDLDDTDRAEIRTAVKAALLAYLETRR